ncbi:nitroreductase [Desulfuribacillus alkaliarsenatis]|uniref:Nitroreductase n=1 Tax=Desulfuribacillus alkaliarsenatis TaxID=766136 RepID=A0A1E5FZ74_9FIRM|nr:nitroreductase [Desulfuribacillus alkaliarsenatis]
MENPQAWYEAIQIRRSRRAFNGKPVEQAIIEELEDIYNNFNKQVTGARIVVVQENADEAFKGIIGSYGKIKGAPAYIAFVGDMDDTNVQEKVGYLGEAAILEATVKGLGTCWVAGFFRPTIVAKHTEIKENEKVLAITPIGYTEQVKTTEEKLMSDMAGSHKRKPLEELYTGLPKQQWSSWVEPALEAARIAPSAVNRQPWRFLVKEQAVTVLLDREFNLYRISKRLDCGIAMLHLEVAALVKGITGGWTLLEDPEIAKFEVSKQ